MSTDSISPLRQRMIEDMSARKLNPHTQRIHISSCKRFAAYLKRSPESATTDEIRLFQLHLTETGEHLQSQPHHDRAPVLVPRDAAALGSCRRCATVKTVAFLDLSLRWTKLCLT